MKQETKIIPRFGPLFPCESWWFSREKKGNPGGHRDLENCVSNSWALQVVQIVMLGDLGLIPGSRRSPGGGHGNPLQYSSLENPHGQRSLADCSP